MLVIISLIIITSQTKENALKITLHKHRGRITKKILEKANLPSASAEIISNVEEKENHREEWFFFKRKPLCKEGVSKKW